MTEDELIQRLREAFATEAQERLANLSSTLMKLENANTPDEMSAYLEVAFREAHSLKGAARAVSFSQVERLCQVVESVFSAAKAQTLPLNVHVLDALLHATAVAEALVDLPTSPPTQGEGGAEDLEQQVEALVQQLSQMLALEEAPEGGSPPPSAGTRVIERPDTSKHRDAQGPLTPENTSASTHETAAARAEPVMQNLRTSPAPLSSVPSLRPASKSSASHRSQKPGGGTLRIAVAKLDTVLLKAEELVTLKLVSKQRLDDLKEVKQRLELEAPHWMTLQPDMKTLKKYLAAEAATGRDASIRPAITALVAFLAENHKSARMLRDQLKQLTEAGEQDHRALSRMVDDLLVDVKQVMMMPCATVFDVMPRMVREISRGCGKEVDLEVIGGEIEIDRRILEELKDPLIHMIRNAIDHGLEVPNERAAQGKERQGTIRLSAAQKDGNKVEILVSDDGRGLDVEALKGKAVARGLLTPEMADAMEESEAFMLAFRSELSTSRLITELSGRGLGLSIVGEVIDRLGGVLTVESTPASGSTFRIQLPVTLATFRGIVVGVAERRFIVPSAQVARVIRVRSSDIKSIEGKATVITDGKVVSFVDLAGVLGLSRPTGDDPSHRSMSGSEATGPLSDLEQIFGNRNGPNRGQDISNYLTALLLGSGHAQVAFQVDAIIDEQEVLVKDLGKQLKRVPCIAGASILGAGQVVPIVRVNDLLKTSTVIPSNVALPTKIHEKKARAEILIAEDSITSRTLLSSILETAGYLVGTAVDGVDAFKRAKNGNFNLMVSDVEMPGMNGFELTKRIRAEKKLENLPIILVTSLDSRENKERGIDAGADAYIVKGSFDQSNLLQVVSRLLGE